MRGTLLLLVLVVLVPLLVVQAGIYAAWYYTRWSEQEAATLDTAREAATTFEAYIRDVRRQESAIGAALTGPHHLHHRGNQPLSDHRRPRLSFHPFLELDRSRGQDHRLQRDRRRSA